MSLPIHGNIEVDERVLVIVKSMYNALTNNSTLKNLSHKTMREANFTLGIAQAHLNRYMGIRREQAPGFKGNAIIADDKGYPSVEEETDSDLEVSPSENIMDDSDSTNVV